MTYIYKLGRFLQAAQRHLVILSQQKEAQYVSCKNQLRPTNFA